MPSIPRLIRNTGLVLLVAGCGCTGGGRFVKKGVNSYNAGDYQRALAAFNQIETSRMELSARGKVQYLTYRGLAHYRLGHRELARRFLTEALLVYRVSDPSWLPVETISQLHRALAELTRGDAGPIPPGPGPNSAEPIDIQ